MSSCVDDKKKVDYAYSYKHILSKSKFFTKIALANYAYNPNVGTSP